jgi:hypothetical protein
MTAAPSKIEADPIGTFMPWTDQSEWTLRRRLVNARNIATARATSSRHSRARGLYWLTSYIAGDWMLTPAPADDLKDMADTLVRLFLCAGAIERLEAPDEG